MREQENRIMEELRRNNIDAETVCVTKNGYSCMGIRLLKDGAIAPVIYYDEHDSTNDIMHRVLDVLNQEVPSFDTTLLQDPTFVLDHVYISVQRHDDEDIIKKSYLNLDATLRLQVSLGEDYGSIKVNQNLLLLSGISEEEAWSAAINSLNSNIYITSMEEALGMPPGMMAAPFDVVSTSSGRDGAAALMLPGIFWQYCHDRKLIETYIIPSSRDELLILKASALQQAEHDLQGLAQMIQEINASCVDPTLQLDPVVYKYDLIANEITIVASAEEVESGVA